GVACESGFAHVDFVCGKHLVCTSETEYEEWETVPCWEVEDIDPECCEGGECHFVGAASCPDGHTCVLSPDWGVDDQCLPCDACTPDCAGRECGNDSCGGVCGTCDEWLFCQDGMCVNGDPPQCQGKMCGPDGMGGSCGSCLEDWDCGAEGRCAPAGGGCGDVDAEGTCINGWKVTCPDGEPQYEPCPFNACVVPPGTGVAECSEVPCPPDCFGKVCGDDGCGSGTSCGECTWYQKCKAGACVSKDGCGGSTQVRCSGHGLVSCVDEKWTVTPCPEQGMICGPMGCGGLPGCRPVWPDTFTCDDLPEGGSCAGDDYFHCVDGFLEVDHCRSLGPYICGRTGIDELGCKLD
ncbi:MAG: hypothetical protein ABIK09_03945, partial [Pseudomonadota bacterium]